MSTTTLDTDMLSTHADDARSGHSLTGFGRSLRNVLAAVRQGITAGHHYEALRGQGLGSQEALNRALAETGFGS